MFRTLQTSLFGKTNANTGATASAIYFQHLDNPEVAAMKSKIQATGLVDTSGNDANYQYATANIYNQIKTTGHFCDYIDHGYAISSLRNADMLMGTFGTTRNAPLLGFITMDFVKNGVYISLICTNNTYKGIGKHMINLLAKICKIVGIKVIKLGAVTDAVPFYYKMGFYCDNGECPMHQTIIYDDSDDEDYNIPKKAKKKEALMAAYESGQPPNDRESSVGSFASALSDDKMDIEESPPKGGRRKHRTRHRRHRRRHTKKKMRRSLK